MLGASYTGPLAAGRTERKNFGPAASRFGVFG